MGDFMSFRLNLILALTVGLARHELSNFRLKALPKCLGTLEVSGHFGSTADVS